MYVFFMVLYTMIHLKNLAVPDLKRCLELADNTDVFVLENTVFTTHSGLLGSVLAARKPFIIADENTLAAAGTELESCLSKLGIDHSKRFVFPALPVLHAEYSHVLTLVSAMKQDPDARNIMPVALGSGTINDLVKRASAELDLPYICIPTATSVDGFTSAGAALLDHGFKKTFPCPAPKAVIADPGILAATPSYLSSSGFGDLASKLVAGSDWIIAEHFADAGAPGTEPIDAQAWAMTQSGLRTALARSETAAAGNKDAAKELFMALSLTGFAMQYTRSSRPVSGCEHLYSHVWEMSNLCVDGIPVTHGHKVAIGTLCAAGLSEMLFNNESCPSPRMDPPLDRKAREKQVRLAFAAFSPVADAAVDAAVKTALEKIPAQESLQSIRKKAQESWPQLRRYIKDQIPPYHELKAQLERAGCPVRPEQIGLTRKEAIMTAVRAQMIRNRYTVLDLAWDLGLLEWLLAELDKSRTYLR